MQNGKNKKILVAEEDQFIRNYIVELCKKQNPAWQVWSFGTTGACLPTIKQTAFDLAILDLSILGIRSVALAHLLRHANPEIGLLFMSFGRLSDVLLLGELEADPRVKIASKLLHHRSFVLQIMKLLGDE